MSKFELESKLLNYCLLDSGDGKKLEKVGKYIISRPCQVAVWRPSMPKKVWDEADLFFTRDGKNKGQWKKKKGVKDSWVLELEGIKFQIKTTDFGHLGAFFEHSHFFKFIDEKIKIEIKKSSEKKNVKLLNLFAYTGGVTLAAAKAGAEVTHIDASKPAISWAKENALLNDLQNNNKTSKGSIRYIADDAIKFLKREIRRKNFYDAIVLDPPTFGRGTSGEVFKIERDLYELLSLCKNLLSKTPLFVIFSCHTPGFTKEVLKNISSQIFKTGKLSSSDLFLKDKEDNKNKKMAIPTGCYVIWEREK